jgi:hypothetical protein
LSTILTDQRMIGSISVSLEAKTSLSVTNIQWPQRVGVNRVMAIAVSGLFWQFVRLGTLALAFVPLLLSSSVAQVANQQDTSDSPVQSRNLRSAGNFEARELGLTLEATIGLGGKWKVGSTTAIRIQATAAKALSGYLTLEIVDGDGVPVLYRYPERIDLQPNQTMTLEWLFRAGRANAEANLIWNAEASSGPSRDERLWAFYPAELATPLPSNQPWLVEIGELKMGLESGVNQRGRLPRYSTSTLTDVASLPTQWSAYQGVDLVALSTLDLAFIQSIPTEKFNALTEFVRSGGRLFISLGKNSIEIAQLPWLSELLPGFVRSLVPNVNASMIESMVGTSKQRLEGLSMPMLQLTRGISEFTITLPNRQRLQVISRAGLGLGQVIVFAADLNAPPLSDWEDRPALIQRLLQNQWVVPDEKQGAATATSNSYLGYDDLFGQLRAALDTFPQVRTISFSYLAVLLVLFLLIIGPVEYYLCIRGANRSGWTWLALIIVVVAASAMVVRNYNIWRPQAPLVQAVELIDIEASTGYQRGRVWFHTYHSAPAQLDFSAKLNVIGQGDVRQSSIDWQPLSGKGIGGLESGIRSFESLPPYSARIASSATTSNAMPSNAKLSSVPFPAGSTKSLRVDWTGQASPLKFGNLKEIAGSGMLQGEFTNTLDVDLVDATLLYHNLVYTFPSRLKPGASEKFTILSTPKDLERRLTRRVTRDGKDITKPWDPASRTDMPQLIEMIGFYKAAGGEKFTSLQHRLEPTLDMSDLLTLDRAILLARLPSSPTKIKVTSPQGEIEYQPEASTFIRCIIPIRREN